MVHDKLRFVSTILQIVGFNLHAEHRQPFDETKHSHTLNELGDVAEGWYDWKIERGRGGISL